MTAAAAQIAPDSVQTAPTRRRPLTIRELIAAEFARTDGEALVYDMIQAGELALAGRPYRFGQAASSRGRSRWAAEQYPMTRSFLMTMAQCRKPLWVEGWLDTCDFGLMATFQAEADDRRGYAVIWWREALAAAPVFLPVVITIDAEAAVPLRAWQTPGTKKLLRIYSDSQSDRDRFEQQATGLAQSAVATAIGCVTGKGAWLGRIGFPRSARCGRKRQS